MPGTIENKLDNPVWYSLSETHLQFAVDYQNIKFYHPDYCPFGGFYHNKNISNSISNYASLISNFFIVGNRPPLPKGLTLKNNLVCHQMVINDRITTDGNETILRLTKQQSILLYQLVNFVQPGYFREKTSMLGEYFGIFKDEKLIAVTGERMQMNEFTEVSAVVTHPDYAGKGYAKQLVAHTVNNILDQGKQPFLHVAETNIGAIKLYEKLGFTTRRKISFWNIVKDDKIDG